jgi:hypothetical protein
MIRITDPDKIRTSGDFKLDGLLIKRHEFAKQASELGKESLTIEAVPFKRMDDGDVLASKDRVFKVVLSDVVAEMFGDRLSAECKAAMMDAYFATEKASALLMKELGGLDCVWEAPS